MQTFIEPLYKSDDKIQFGWNPEPVAGITYYKVYVGQGPGTLTLLADRISTQTSDNPVYLRKVAFDAMIDDVRTVLSLPSTLNFGNLLLYFAITYVNSAGAESPITSSRVVEVPPVGILGKTQREDPTANRHIFGFSDEIQRWIKIATSGTGAIIVSSSDYYSPNMTTMYTRDSSGNVLTEKTYFSDRTSSGSPAKLLSYSYADGFVSKVTVSDSTV